MARALKNCRRCGNPFEASRADTTVNCPDCRSTLRNRPAAGPTTHDLAVIDAKRRGYAARKAGDDAAYKAAVQDLNFLLNRKEQN
jgi:hypothetical protein